MVKQNDQINSRITKKLASVNAKAASINKSIELLTMEKAELQAERESLQEMLKVAKEKQDSLLPKIKQLLGDMDVDTDSSSSSSEDWHASMPVLHSAWPMFSDGLLWFRGGYLWFSDSLPWLVAFFIIFL